MENLERTKSFTFKGKEYKIEFPTVGEYIEIENQKIIHSNGQWANLIQNQTISAFRSIQIIECISLLIVLCPQLFSDMNVSSYKEIDAIDFLDLLLIYNKEINPWYSKWFNQFNSILLEANDKLKD